MERESNCQSVSRALDKTPRSAQQSRMNKIPVGKTVAFAYNFLFTRFGTVVGVAALPAVLASAVDYLVRSYTSTEESEAAGGVNLLIWLSGTVTTIFISSVATVGIIRAALGLPLGSGAYYFPVGPLELRMFVTKLRFWLGVAVLLILASLAASVAFMLAGVPIDGAGTVEPSAATLIAGFAAWAAFAYAILTIIRMGFLLPATVVSEDKGGLQRSHDLSRGNFWRMVAVVLALAAPILVLVSVAGAVILRASLGPDYARVLEQDGMLELMRRGEEAVAQNLLLWEAFNAAIFILASGLVYAASAYAYRAVTGKPPPDTGAR
jgi:hypothetical protein